MVLAPFTDASTDTPAWHWDRSKAPLHTPSPMLMLAWVLSLPTPKTQYFPHHHTESSAPPPSRATHEAVSVEFSSRVVLIR